MMTVGIRIMTRISFWRENERAIMKIKEKAIGKECIFPSTVDTLVGRERRKIMMRSRMTTTIDQGNVVADMDPMKASYTIVTMIRTTMSRLLGASVTGAIAITIATILDIVMTAIMMTILTVKTLIQNRYARDP